MKTPHLISTLCSARYTHVSLACLLGAVLPACVEPTTRDLGLTQSTEDLSLESAGPPFYTGVDTVVGRWVGQAEEPLVLSDDTQTRIYRFPSSSTRIVVELQADEEYQLIGQVTFGVGEPLPPATDPDVGYPAGVAYDELIGYPLPDDDFFLNTATALPPFEGFAYELTLASSTYDDEVPDGVVNLAFNANQPLGSWCELQTSYPREFGGSSCVPDFGGSFETRPGGSGALCAIYGPYDYEACEADPDACEGEVMAEVDCDKSFVCNYELCSCGEAGCVAARSGSTLTFRRTGDVLVGLFGNILFKNARGLNVPLGEVRLQLEP